MVEITHPPEKRLTLKSASDWQSLAHIRERFLTVNQGRIARAMESLAPRQQSFLRLLALFFHVNHRSLPGYVSDCTPAGVSGYEPDASVISTAKRLVGEFTYASSPKRRQPIHSVFLMGSLGTLAQTDESDMDVWVCHGPQLTEAERIALKSKCRRLEVWAASQGVEAHCFLIDTQRFALGEHEVQLCTENGGTTQHHLLLDEFYRTALWLAGRTPLWWYVPESEESRYAEFTRATRDRSLIGSDDVMDLGHLARIPTNEFLGAGLWQLFKGIESPHKSVLKLLLIEVYASEHPHVNYLSMDFKQAVYANHLDLDELDPYMMVYRRIERYLTAIDEMQRLEQVRRSLYLKVNCTLTGPTASRGRPWQRQLLERLTAEWGWDESLLTSLDNRSHWKAEEVTQERLTVARELSISYRFLRQLACHNTRPGRFSGSAAKTERSR